MNIKDGYISYTSKDNIQGFEHFGGFELIDNKPKQVRFTKTELKKRAVKLIKLGYKIGIIEICTYDVDNDEYAELIDPIKRENLTL